MRTFPKQAIILAAGLGTRLRPITDRVPKPALPVAGLPILYYHLFLLHRSGIKDIVVNLHHLPEKIKTLLVGAKKLGLRLQYSLEPKILGTAGGIAQALQLLPNQATFVLNGDILCDIDLKKMAEQHFRSQAKATLAVVPRDRAKVKSFVEIDSKGKVWRIAEGPSEIKTPSHLVKRIFSGIHLIEPSLFSNYPPHIFSCVVRQVYQPALAQGDRIQSYQHQGSWWDLGSLEQWTGVDRQILSGQTTSSILKIWQETEEWTQGLFRHS